MAEQETENAIAPEAPHTGQLLGKIGMWSETILTPEFREFKRKQLSYTISDEFDREYFLKDTPSEFVFSGVIEKQHALVISFLELSTSSSALAQCEYYFRRFPFRGLPISRENHIKNICELYFMHFYIIESRIKAVFENFKKVYPDTKANFGKFIKAYSREFNQELRNRNKINHHYSFGDLDIDKIMLTGMMSSAGSIKGEGWNREHMRAYRNASKVWSNRVIERSAVIRKFVNKIARFILENNDFL